MGATRLAWAKYQELQRIGRPIYIVKSDQCWPRSKLAILDRLLYQSLYLLFTSFLVGRHLKSGYGFVLILFIPIQEWLRLA